MALVVADRVWETTSTSGTGTLTLSGAVSGYQTFAVIGNGNTTYYTITNGTDWEVGIGTYTSSGTTLSRDTVLASSLGGTTKITVTPGSFVFVDYPASRAVYEDESGVVTGYPISGGTINGTTIGATTPSTVNATTLSGQTGVLRGTGQNFILRSSDLTVSPWSASNLTVTGSQSDPFGGTTAALLNEGTANNFHYVNQNVASANGTYTLSVYAKAGTSNFIGLFATVINQGAIFNLTTGAFTGNYIGAPTSYASTNTGLPSGWWRVSIVVTGAFGFGIATSSNGTATTYTGTSQTVTVAAPQLELGNTLNTYIPTTTTAVYGTPTLSFSGVSTLGLESNGALFLQPAGTGAIQAQATTSTTAGGNVRGANAVDWQTLRGAVSQVASGSYSVLGGGQSNQVNGFNSTIAGGNGNQCGSSIGFIGGGASNNGNGSLYTAIVGGQSNTAAGYYNFIGAGFTNSGTSSSAVTTQSGTMNATTAVTLSGSNANIKVGQYISGTSIANDTYVAAISGTALTLSKVASGSSTSTLSFYTPHGIVVGGGNNQATGSYSFIGGGGDAGTAANRNVASGAWSFVGGGMRNTASGLGAVVVGGGDGTATYANTASGQGAFVGGGINNTVNNAYSTVGGGGLNACSGQYSFVGGGYFNGANSNFSTIAGGTFGTARSITGNTVFSANFIPIAFAAGVSQAALLVLARETTNATATVLCSDANAAGTTNQVILPNNSAYYFKGSVIANVTGAANGAAWSIEGAIMRGANAASTVLIDTPSVNRVACSAGATAWVVAVTADTTNGGIAVTVTGVASTTIRWVCKLETTEVTF